MVSKLGHHKQAVFEYDSRQITHYKINELIEAGESGPAVLPIIIETHLIDNESFKKYQVRVARFKPEFVLDLR
jgi:hypothetical protein